MSYMKNTINIPVKADTSQAVGSLKNVESALDQIVKKQNSFGNWAMTASAVVNVAQIAASAIKKIYNAGKELVDIYAIQEQAVTKLRSTIKATGNVIGTSADDMLKLASSLQSVTTYGDETILSVEQIMIATKAISKDALPEATELSLDMAAALGTSVPEAAKKMAKALADPKSGLDGLKDANIIFSEAEKKTINQMIADGKQMEAQQAILDKVAATYGGIARDIASTDTGKLTQIQNVWGDIKEGLGNGLVSALSPALDWLLNQLNKISSWINDLNAEREMASDIMADSSGEKAGNKYSSDTINKYLKEYDKETADAYQTLLSMIPKVDNNGKTIDAPTTIEELKAIFGNSYANEMGVATGLSGAEEAWNFFQSAKNKSSAALKARDIAVAKESAHAVDAYSSSSESVGSSGAVSGVKVQTIDEYIASNVSYSSKAQKDALKAKIDEAWSKYNESLDAGDGKDSILKEIAFGLQKEFDDKYRQEPFSMSEERKQYITDNSSMSKTLAAEALSKKLDEARNWRDSATEGSQDAKVLDEIIAALEKEYESLHGVKDVHEAITECIQQNGSLSALYGKQEIEAQLEMTQSILETCEAGTDEYRIIEQIVDALKEKKDAAETASSAMVQSASKVKEFLDTYASTATSMLSSGFSLADQLMQNEVDALQAQLDKQSDAWDEYYSKLQDKHKIEEAALAAEYASGKISAEDYYSSVGNLQDAEAEAKAKHEKEEETLQAKLNDIKKKQFEANKANSIAQAVISGAQAVVGFLATPGGVPGTVLAAMAGVTAAAQIATIAAEQYTPMATGGIVTTPTLALIGEAGPEAVLPLNSHTAQRLGVSDASGSRITINVVVHNAYTSEDLGKSVFDSIQRLQKTGSLPSWRIA